MADIVNILGKTKKVTLPPGWVERISKKHPDRPFYFNEKTGESRWSQPLDTPKKVMETGERKSKKRKASETESSESLSTISTSGDKLLNLIDSVNRPKLKPRSSKAALNDASEPKIDTPAMRLYREKLAQRKAAIEAKKGGTPKSNKKQNKVAATPEKSSEATTSTSVLTRTLRRPKPVGSVVSNESVSSNCTTVSSTSSMGAKIKLAAVPLVRLSPRSVKNVAQVIPNSIPKISKVQQVRTSISPKGKVTESEALSDTSIGNQSFKDNINSLDTSRRSIKKNLAQERMTNFRKSLSTERVKGSPRSVWESPINNNNIKDTSLDKSKLLNTPTPILHEKAQSRLIYLENRVQNNGLLELTRSKRVKSDEENDNSGRLLQKIVNSDNYFEEMDWEPIEDEKIMSEVYSVRFREKPDTLSELSYNALQPLDTSGGTNALYIVIDTNVFLSNLPLVEEVRDSHSDIFGRPFIVIPWTVLQELDFIKDDKNNVRSQQLKVKARRAVEFLNRHFTAKHPRFLGQTPKDVERNKTKFIIECPDDEILQTCLQIKESSKSPVLLSYDKNLCNKAMIHDIPTIGRNDPLEKIYYLKAAETTTFLSNSLHSHTDNNLEDVSIQQKELLAADDIMEEAKAVLKTVMSKVVATEMENLFGNRWEMHVIIRPPWSVAAVLKCAIKHWMAAVNEAFQRRTEPMLRDLQLCINKFPEGGRKLHDVKFFLEKCNDVVQTLNSAKYHDLKTQTLMKIDNLRENCLKVINELSNERFKESVGSEEDHTEEERRATLAFKVLEDIYAFARDACGIAAEALGLQCSFSYNKMHPFINARLALQQQQDIGVNVVNLLQALRMALSEVDDSIASKEKVILALYEVLVNFSSDLNFDELKELTPLDLFCCLNLKKSKLEKGYEQLQELAIHFCRMANYQCT